MRLLLECTYVYENPRHHTGIQRVVRNMISELGALQGNVESIPVIFRGGRIYRVKSLLPPNALMALANWIHAKSVMGRERFRLHYRQMKTAGRHRTGVRGYCRPGLLLKSVDILIHGFIMLVNHFILRGENGRRIVQLNIQKGDVLILMDASWHLAYFSLIEEFKGRGGTVIVVIYDLMPLTHPQYCHKRLIPIFSHWFDRVQQIADGFMAISKTVRDQVEAYLMCHQEANVSSGQWFDYFQLGSELDQVQKSGAIRPDLRTAFHQGIPVYLMVGTFEPKKNHAYLLDVFEQLWLKKENVALCLVGKASWGFDLLLKRIVRHCEYRQRLFVFNDLGDTELEYCYQNARSLILPAHVEGFGLPLIEAMQRGLPVMANNINVFREVGGDFVAYFDTEKPETLVNLIARYEMCDRFPAKMKLRDWNWPNCAESARQFLLKVANHSKLSPNEA